MNNTPFHKQPVFIFLLSATILLTVGSGIYIFSSLNLVWAPEEFGSYENIGKIIYVPKLIASGGFAILAFYALWFRINQTTKQIENQEVQITEIREHKKIDLLIAEINEASKRIYEINSIIEKPNSELINHITDEILKKEDISNANIRHDVVNKLTKIEFSNRTENIIKWRDSITNLTNFLRRVSKSSDKKGYKEAYEKHYDSIEIYKHALLSIQLETIIMNCAELSKVGESQFTFVKGVLTSHQFHIKTLNNIGKLDQLSYSMYWSLARLTGGSEAKKEGFVHLIASEMYKQDLIPTDDKKQIVSIKILTAQEGDEQRELDFAVNTKNGLYHRKAGIYYKQPTEDVE